MLAEIGPMLAEDGSHLVEPGAKLTTNGPRLDAFGQNWPTPTKVGNILPHTFRRASRRMVGQDGGNNGGRYGLTDSDLGDNREKDPSNGINSLPPRSVEGPSSWPPTCT